VQPAPCLVPHHVACGMHAPSVLPVWLWHLVAPAAASCAWTQPHAPSPATAASTLSVELSNSVILVSLHDLTPGSGERQGQRQCEAVIERAARWKSRSISLVVTAHWAGGRKGASGWCRGGCVNPAVVSDC
jgi:hypothetical protein